VTTLAKTCRHGKEEMRQYGKFVFSLFFFHGTRATFTKFELKFFFVDWERVETVPKEKQQHPG
jgi:hypothetical protein